MPHVFIATPGGDRPTWEFTASMLQMQVPPGMTTSFHYIRGQAVDVARNALVDAFMLSDAEWLWLVDADAELHSGTLGRLLSWGKPVVGALAFSRYAPILPTICAGQSGEVHWYWVRVQETVDWLLRYPELVEPGAAMLEAAPLDSLREIRADEGGFTGGHCLLVHREVLLAIEPPWFERTAAQRIPSQEDRYFCEKIHKAGFSIHVDRSVVAGHSYGDRPLGALDFLAWNAITDWSKHEFVLGGKHDETKNPGDGDALPGPANVAE